MGERSSSGPSTTEGGPSGGILPAGRGEVETVLSSTTQTATTSHNFILELLPTRAPDREKKAGLAPRCCVPPVLTLPCSTWAAEDNNLCSAVLTSPCDTFRSSCPHHLPGLPSHHEGEGVRDGHRLLFAQGMGGCECVPVLTAKSPCAHFPSTAGQRQGMCPLAGPGWSGLQGCAALLRGRQFTFPFTLFSCFSTFSLLFPFPSSLPPFLLPFHFFFPPVFFCFFPFSFFAFFPFLSFPLPPYPFLYPFPYPSFFSLSLFPLPSPIFFPFHFHFLFHVFLLSLSLPVFPSYLHIFFFLFYFFFFSSFPFHFCLLSLSSFLLFSSLLSFLCLSLFPSSFHLSSLFPSLFPSFLHACPHTPQYPPLEDYSCPQPASARRQRAENGGAPAGARSLAREGAAPQKRRAAPAAPELGARYPRRSRRGSRPGAGAALAPLRVRGAVLPGKVPAPTSPRCRSPRLALTSELVSSDPRRTSTPGRRAAGWAMHVGQVGVRPPGPSSRGGDVEKGDKVGSLGGGRGQPPAEAPAATPAAAAGAVAAAPRGSAPAPAPEPRSAAAGAARAAGSAAWQRELALGAALGTLPGNLRKTLHQQLRGVR